MTHVERFLPLAWLCAFHAIVFLRDVIHRRRTGKSGNVFLRGRSFAERTRATWYFALFGLAWIQAALVATGTLGVAPDPRVRWAGIALAFGGMLAMFGAQLALRDSWRIGIEEGARPGLVTDGVYRVSRNPIFACLLAAWAGFTVWMWSPWVALLYVTVVFGVRRHVREEEAWLSATYGEAYDCYAARVGRFVPGFGRIAPRASSARR